MVNNNEGFLDFGHGCFVFSLFASSAVKGFSEAPVWMLVLLFRCRVFAGSVESSGRKKRPSAWRSVGQAPSPGQGFRAAVGDDVGWSLVQACAPYDSP